MPLVCLKEQFTFTEHIFQFSHCPLLPILPPQVFQCLSFSPARRRKWKKMGKNGKSLFHNWLGSAFSNTKCERYLPVQKSPATCFHLKYAKSLSLQSSFLHMSFINKRNSKEERFFSFLDQRQTNSLYKLYCLAQDTVISLWQKTRWCTYLAQWLICAMFSSRVKQHHFYWHLYSNRTRQDRILLH